MATEENFHIDPVSQFEIHSLWDIHIAGINFSYTNASLFMTIGAVIFMAFFYFATRGSNLVPTRLQAMGELLHMGVVSMLRDGAGDEGMRFLPLIFTVFFITLMGNLLGMIPGGFTYTSQIAFTLAFAMTLFIFITVLGFVIHGKHFLTRFVPPGVPKAMIPFVALMEMISYFVRPFTLAIRLFANMLAGHMAMKVFAYFAVGLVTSSSAVFMTMGIAPIIANTAMIGLEFFVAVLQAMIFTILTSVYLRDALVIEH